LIFGVVEVRKCWSYIKQGGKAIVLVLFVLLMFRSCFLISLYSFVDFPHLIAVFVFFSVLTILSCSISYYIGTI
jgi:hypothetical protein